MIRALLIDEEAIEKVNRVVAYARQHVFYPDLTKAIPGHNPNHVADLSTYRCVFTFTKDPDAGGLFRHLSISVPSEGYPNIEAVSMIAGLFGFTESEKGTVKRLEDRAWLMYIDQEAHCIILVEELRDEKKGTYVLNSRGGSN